MKKNYLTPWMTVYQLSPGNCILAASGTGDSPSFDDFSGENIDWIISASSITDLLI